VLINVYWWVKCALTFDDFEATLEAYLSVFPDFIANGRLLAKVKLLLTAINIGVLIYLLTKRWQLVVSISLLSINALLFTWALFSLM
jgi:hypothetical protein